VRDGTAPEESSVRDRQLDLVRGVAVAGMFFFSLVAALSNSLPTILTHNVPGSLLPGDLVLSLFLWASGASLTIMFNRYKTLKNWGLWRKLIKRLTQMIVVSIIVTPFSAGSLLGMDEMMLNVVLTIPALVVVSFGPKITYLIIFGIWIAHEVAVSLGLIPSLPPIYLGGYPLAIFWLPILLSGSLSYNLSWGELKRSSPLWGALTAMAICGLGKADKMSITASFGALSVFIAIGLLAIFRRYQVTSSYLEYFGSKPLRMWFLMFCLLGPIRLYAESHQLVGLALSLSPSLAVVGSLGWMMTCYGISRGCDFFKTHNHHL